MYVVDLFLARKDSHLPCFLFYINVLNMVKKMVENQSKEVGEGFLICCLYHIICHQLSSQYYS